MLPEIVGPEMVGNPAFGILGPLSTDAAVAELVDAPA